MGSETASRKRGNQRSSKQYYPNRIILLGKLLRWGNSYGIRLSRKDVERLGMKENAELIVEVRSTAEERVDLSSLPSIPGLGKLADSHDEEEWA